MQLRATSSAKTRASGASALQRRTAQPTERGGSPGIGTSRSGPSAPGTRQPGRAGTTAWPRPSSARSRAVSQSATLVSELIRMPRPAKAASRWAREAEFPGSRMCRMPVRSAGSTRVRTARGSSAPTASTQGRFMTGRCSMPRTGRPMVIQARSRSSAASASKQLRLEFSVWNSRLTRGCRRRKVTTASDMKCRTDVAPVVTRTEPPSPRTRSSSRRRAPSRPEMPSAAAAWRIRPASVGTTPRAWRSSRPVPVSFSRRRMCWLTADWVRPRSRATALRLPARHTATKTRRSSRVTGSR
ncbi:hypothetical protein AMK15_22415 [Streptomyces sp. MJM1172]|nr:hypothetical protein AMK15_22415 [Streptomyces sp. MJM1172]